MALEKKVTESGAKAHQRNDTEWRIQPYSDWHRTLDKRLLMLDVDFIEWRFRDGILVPVGVMEITRVDYYRKVTARYLEAIIHRYTTRDMQSRAIRHVASSLGTKAYIVLFLKDCSHFWVYNLSDNIGWDEYTPVEMEKFLRRL